MSISIVRGTQLSALFLFGLVTGQAGAAEGTTVTVESMPAKDVAVESTAAEAVAVQSTAVQSTTTKSATYGLGAGASGNGATIYFPVRIGALIVEPHISYYHREDKFDGTGTDIVDYPPSSSTPDTAVPITSQQVYLTERMDLGLGVFTKSQITDELELYYGGRFGYQTSKQHQQYSQDYSSGMGYVNTSSHSSSQKLTGYFLAPAFGLQYFPRPNFSLGIEVSLRYSSLSGDNDETDSNTTNNPTGSSSTQTRSGDADDISYSTTTAAIIRGYF